jgi:TolB-like protein/class 3 adenylate cyclase
MEGAKRAIVATGICADDRVAAAEGVLSVERVERRLAAILAADVAGYSRLMGHDEAGTLARLNALRRDLIDPEVAEHKGRIVKTTGDGILIEFPSVVEAVACAVAVQQAMATHNAAIPQDQRIEFRIGINSGDVIVEDGDIHGEGVNIAARLEALAEPGMICVSAIVQGQVEGRLDCAFEDQGEQSLKNIARPVRVYRVEAGPRPSRPHAGETPALHGPALALPDKPSIAVLPFQNMSGDPEQEYFADGMVEEIITALSRIRWLFVIARNSSFAYKGQHVDVKQVGRELGVRYVLEGSVRKGGNRVRITAQLVDAQTGAHLWADRFDGSLEDVFDLQDKVASSVAGVIEPTLQAAETARAANRPTTDLPAYDAYLRACAMVSASEQMPQALDLLELAIARDPHYGSALAWAAICCMRICGESIRDADITRRKGVSFARRALQVAGGDPAILANAALVLASFGEDIDAMMALVDRALMLNPNFARGWHVSAYLRLWAGKLNTAIDHAEASLRLNPRGRLSGGFYVIGTALLCAQRFDEAIPKLLLAIQGTPNFAAPYRALAASYAHLGRLDEARAILARLRALTPLVVPSDLPFRNSEYRERFLSGLGLAMGDTA